MKWSGKVAVFTVGAAVLLALVFGVATTALGATGGNFILGKANVAGAASRLTAGISDPALQVVNNGAGTALDLRVGSLNTTPADKTVAPMKVDSQARVANLNADEIDGRDATSFAASTHAHSGEDITGGTVAEARIDDSLARDDEVISTVQVGDGSGSSLYADHLDGKDSSAFLLVDGKARDSIHADGRTPLEALTPPLARKMPTGSTGSTPRPSASRRSTTSRIWNPAVPRRPAPVRASLLGRLAPHSPS